MKYGSKLVQVESNILVE